MPVLWPTDSVKRLHLARSRSPTRTSTDSSDRLSSYSAGSTGVPPIAGRQSGAGRLSIRTMDIQQPLIGRRRLLLGVGAAALVAGCGDRSGIGRVAQGNRGKLRWTNPLHIPVLDGGEMDADGIRRFSLDASEGRSEFLRGHPTRTWGFNGAYLGPTLRANRGDKVLVQVRNDLDETTTVHWHGMKLPATMDGTPHQPIAPGDTWKPTWTIDQPAATLWYHPHPHGETAAHVYRGLGGMWIVDDPDTDGDLLPHDYGIDDIPVVIQDRDIDDNGELVENRPVAFWGLMGNQIIVNGTFDPYLDVTTRLVRLRILNGSNARVYNLRFDDGRPFHVVGNDCGLLARPVPVDEVTLSPAERVEALVEFAPEDTTVLRSHSGGHSIDDGNFDILQMRAGRTLTDNTPIPERLPGRSALSLPTNPTRRQFTLAGDSKINSKSMDMTRIDDVVALGAVEQWKIWAPGVPHNFHIHNAAFTVLDIDGQTPPAHLAGPKDTVFVPAGSEATLAVGFGNHTDPTTPYMYHCHILRHEDRGMMGQFTIVEPDQLRDAPRSIPASHHD